MGAPARMMQEDRGDKFEREGETHMNGNVRNVLGARERRRVRGEAEEGVVPQGRSHRNHMRGC